MKKILTLLFTCVICVMVPVMALAMTQKEWNQQCILKTSAAIPYFLTEKAGDNSELATGTDIPMWRAGTLPAGTYIKQIGFDDQLNMWVINYFDGSDIAEVYIRDYQVNTASRTVSIYDGKNYETRAVPEALIGDDEALCKYLAKEMPGYTFSMMADGTTVLKEKGTGADGEQGMWKSLKQQAIEAAAALNLNIDDLRVALIYAPRTGKASLRRTAAGNGKVIDKLLDGTVVYIVQESGKFTQVLAGNMTGYIITTALEMVDPDQLPLGEGLLTYKGQTTGKAKINMRSDPGSQGRKITTWPVGTPVLVWSLSEDGAWYEVEANGIRLYVQAEYLTVTELYDYGAEEANEAVADEAGLYEDDTYDGDAYGDYEEYDEGYEEY